MTGRVRVTGAVGAAGGDRLRTLCEAALVELDPDLSMEVRVVEIDEAELEGAWASRHGVFFCADMLDPDHQELPCVAAEETAHYFFLTTHGDRGGPYFHELFAVWFVAGHCGTEWDPGAFDENDSYLLGRLVGSALAGGSAARTALDGIEPGLRKILVELVDRLDGIRDPREFARELASYRDGLVSRRRR